MKINKDGIIVSLKKGVESSLTYCNPQTNEEFKVYYNSRRSSKTVSQKPDNILSMHKDSSIKSYEFIFDAKYKIDTSPEYIQAYGSVGPKEEDINTMHRYRDAIIYDYNKDKLLERKDKIKNPGGAINNCIFGAFVLFPYDNEEEFKKHKFYKSIEEVNIGAIPFLPSTTKLMEDEVEISMENKEFPKENYEEKEIPSIDLIRADFLTKFTEKANNKKHYYHIEFQIKNDNDMIIRTFEYGFNYAKEVARTEGNNKTVLYFPKQRVIYMEENKNIVDVLNMTIIFPNNQKVEYSVPVIKYWKYDINDLKLKGMYPLIPLQLFKLRKELQNIIDSNKENKEEILKEHLYEAKESAKLIAYTCDELFKDKLIEGSDFHIMLLTIQNLIEYLNSKYFRDVNIEKEVKSMTKTLYDPEVERKGEEKKAIEIAKNLLKLGVDIDKIIKGTGLSEKVVKELIKEVNS